MRSVLTVALAAVALCAQDQGQTVGRYERWEASFSSSSTYTNPFREAQAEAIFIAPDRTSRTIPLFWDGGKIWKLRFSPDLIGRWSYHVASQDQGLNGASGFFICANSQNKGGIRVSKTFPGHFERANGEPFYFLGDTAWGYVTNSEEDRHDRSQAEHYARTRASGGFNVIHVMLLSEQGVGNNGGPPFHNMAGQKINPAYWQEVDQRLAFANEQGLTVGLALAWGDKQKVEPYAWRRFPNIEARQRYARYIAARYSAYDVYFLLAGEWHAELYTRATAEQPIFQEFAALGQVLAQADPHDRMIGIHPMTSHGSTREFASLPWISFADYQQNYRHLHERALLSRGLPGPVVNSEYGYLLRDVDGDGKPDKDNSLSTEDMRFATWDIAMAGAYVVTGFGTTYYGGHRDPGPFDVDAAKNDEWETQIEQVRRFFEQVEWMRLVPSDSLLESKAPRGPDRTAASPANSQASGLLRPPAVTYWALSDPGQRYVLYVRGTSDPVKLNLESHAKFYRVRRFDPRNGQWSDVEKTTAIEEYEVRPPDRQDWLYVLEATVEQAALQKSGGSIRVAAVLIFLLGLIITAMVLWPASRASRLWARRHANGNRESR